MAREGQLVARQLVERAVQSAPGHHGRRLLLERPGGGVAGVGEELLAVGLALGVEAVEQSVVRVTFEGPTDYNRFIRNLTSVATAPLLRRYVSATPYDWAKKPSSIATSGPFKLGKINYQIVKDEKGKDITATDDNALNKDGTLSTTNNNKKWDTKALQYFVLERNSYFARDLQRDPVNASVTPYRL